MNQSVFDRLLDVARTAMIPNGDEDTYFAGYHDGQIALARELCELSGMKVQVDETEYDSTEDDE
jgi:hypothetical protein